MGEKYQGIPGAEIQRMPDMRIPSIIDSCLSLSHTVRAILSTVLNIYYIFLTVPQIKLDQRESSRQRFVSSELKKALL